MRTIFLTLAVLTAFAPLRAPAAPATPSTEGGLALVRFAAGTPAAVQTVAHARAAASVVRSVAGGYTLVRTSAPLDQALASYRNDPSVVVAERDWIARIAASPDDPCVSGPCGGSSSQWSLAMTNAAWDEFPTASQKKALPRVTVAVLDTKIDASHPDFANAGASTTDAAGGGQIDRGAARDWIDASAQSGSAAYHGTYVAGLVAAATNNAAGVAAVGARATILPLTVVDGTGRADAASLADGIVYAWQAGARVINLSLGLGEDSRAVHDAIIRVTGGSAPSLVVAAAGNNTGTAAFYPGSYPEVMSVAGTSSADAPASCSNYNANVSVSAPAEQVVSLAPGGGYAKPPCGTSAAAPQVSGLAAALIAQDPSRTPAQVRRIIEQSADDLGPAGRDDRFGFGRINADRALHPGGPSVALPRTTIPSTGDRKTTVTARASAPGGVRAARVFVDSLSSAPVALPAADGSFGDTTEELRGTLTVPASMPAGPHPIWVSAFDGARWGVPAVGVLLVDGTAPVISNAAASNALRAASQPVTVTFTLADDYSHALTYGIQVFDAADHVVFQDARTNVPQGFSSYEWSPAAAVLPGSYHVKIIAVDQAGKSSATLVGAVVA